MSYRSRCEENLREYVRTRYERVPVRGGKAMFNRACLYNTVEVARQDNSRVYECILLENGRAPILHYINGYEDGGFVDNTLGSFAEDTTHEYYVIRRIAIVDYAYISSEFVRSRKAWTAQFTHRIAARLCGIEYLI